MFLFGLDLLGRVLLVMLRNLMCFVHGRRVNCQVSEQEASGHLSGTHEVWCLFTLWSMIPFPRQPNITLLHMV